MDTDIKYIIVNDNDCEFIDPFVSVGDMSIEMTTDTFAKLYLFATINYWGDPAIRVVYDYVTEYQDILFGDGYEDVTAEVADAFMSRC